MNTIKAPCPTHGASADGNAADDREAMRIVREIMVEYPETLEALAKSEAEDRAPAKSTADE